MYADGPRTLQTSCANGAGESAHHEIRQSAETPTAHAAWPRILARAGLHYPGGVSGVAGRAWAADRGLCRGSVGCGSGALTIGNEERANERAHDTPDRGT